MRVLIEFEKTERIRHLGLLDMQRTWQRVLRRSHLPVAYSKGFNPHMLMSFASALSSGIPGERELLDVAMEEDVTEAQCLQALQAVLSEDMPVRRVRLVDTRFPKLGALLEQAEYHFELQGEGAGQIAAGLSAYLAQTEIMALRKSKTQEKMVDIRPMIHALTGEGNGDRATLNARVSFTEPATLKPTLLLESICAFAEVPIPHAFTRRTNLYGVQNGAIVPLFDIDPTA